MDERPEIDVAYSLTYAEFVAGSKLGMRQSLPTFLLFVVARYLGAIAAVFFSFLVAFSFFDGQREAAWRLLPASLLLDLLPFLFTWQWRRGYEGLRSSTTAAPDLAFRANEKEFARGIGGKGELTWRWAATQGFSENRKVVAIAARKGAFIILPRRVLTDLQAARLREMQKNGKA